MQDRMTVLLDPLVAHLGPISDPHRQTHCMELTDKLLKAPGHKIQHINITCGVQIGMSAILFKCSSTGHSHLSFIALRGNQEPEPISKPSTVSTRKAQISTKVYVMLSHHSLTVNHNSFEHAQQIQLSLP